MEKAGFTIRPSTWAKAGLVTLALWAVLLAPVLAAIPPIPPGPSSAGLSAQAADTVLGNATAGSAVPTALPVPSCNTGNSAVGWTTSSGFFCQNGFGRKDLVNTWALGQTFTVAPIFTDQSGTRTALGLGTAATVATGTSGATIPLLNGTNTWASTQTFTVAPVFTAAANTRTALGLATGATTTVGTMATQNASAVAITGGSVAGITDITVADGGTGASTAAAARTNLGVGLTKIGSGTVTSAASGWVTGLNTTYSRYKLMIAGYRCSSSGATSSFRISTDNQSTTYSGATYYTSGSEIRSSDGTASTLNSQLQSSGKLTNDMVTGVNTSPGSMSLDLFSSNTEYFNLNGTILYQSSASGYRWAGVVAMVAQYQPTDLNFVCSAGNISFTWTLYAYE